ncbi:hypothetical protein PAHA111176_01115 [Parendozoicomonas haliclonae]|uniref:Zinc-regulated TonB-dependent outer membrane receptor n=2 Tax=Parendozoicomonas haliclonae TaxID=1960125 RepID=A0A1X7AGS2_9GAMM|nr:hypothetical protein EHSB41UT_01028 [Parendozoicomonas haliclonae]
MLATASSTDFFDPKLSLILDGQYTTEKSALSERNKGWGIGHIELGLSSTLGDYFYGKYMGTLHEHGSKIEYETEEAFIQTLALPDGFSLRAGRFLSDVGYLNGQHAHADSFSSRPAVYRGMLGDHYYDDGARLSYVMPTDIYWVLGAEAFRGKKMRAVGITDPESVGVYTAFTKIGGDFDEENSWQLGLSYLRNRNGAGVSELDHDEEEHEDHEHHDEHGDHEEHGHEDEGHHEHAGHDDHNHSHGAAYTGKDTYLAEAVWKWAPGGNYKYQSLTLSGEYLISKNISQTIKNDENHEGFYLSGVYQMSPEWFAGVRYGEVEGYEAHGDHFHEQTLKETDVVLGWTRSHAMTVKLQYTHQSGDDLPNIAGDMLTLQFTMSLGDHDAHSF